MAALAIPLLVGCDKPETPAPAPATPVSAPVDSAPSRPGQASIPDAPNGTTGSPATQPTASVTPTEQQALERFKADIQSIRKFMEENEANEDPSAGLENLRQLVRRATAVETDGLPADLAEAYAAMTASLKRIGETLDRLPVPVHELENYLMTEAAKGQEAGADATALLSEFTQAMEARQLENRTASAHLKKVSAKYGIEAVAFDGE